MRILPVILLAAAAARAGERETVVVKLQKTATSKVRPRVLFPQTRFPLVARRPARLEGVPELSKDSRYAEVVIGDRTLRLAFSLPKGGPALGVLHGAPGKVAYGVARPAGDDAFTVEFDQADCQGLICNVRLFYRGHTVTGGVLEPAFHMRGKTVLDGVVREVVLVDADADGAYDGPHDRWVALRAEKARHIKTLRRPAALLPGEPQIPFEKDGRALTVENVAADGSSLTLVLDEPKVELENVLRRRYAEVREEHFAEFERELVDFVEKQGLDVARARVRKPVAWRRIPLSEGIKIAKRERKPLLVSFFTESNAWCYRYEYYTFRDAEVDRLLHRFVLVRIDAEKDAERSYQSHNARGLPTLMPLTAAGQPVSFRVRTREKDLAANETMITGWQRPTELAVNLKRILKACSER